MGQADSVDVSTSITNITADNVTVYVEGDYNPATLYHPRVSELHMGNNTNGALWNPILKELPTTLHAAVMRNADIAILYDGWIDLENTGTLKPYGATREAEILGYDIYAKVGETYAAVVGPVIGEDNLERESITGYQYVNSGRYAHSDAVNYTWAVIQLYRAMGIEQVEFLVSTSEAPEEFDINKSPLVQFLSMQTMGPDLSAAVATVCATRTNPETYLAMADMDGIAVPYTTDRESQTLSVAEFCVLAYTLMQLYGEPVLTEQETYLLLEAYGRELPYGLPSNQLEAVKYLLARGIVESDLSWKSDITFADAATILMRIKDTGSRLTFKEIQLTTDVGLLAKGYYSTEVSSLQSPVEVVDQFSSYDTYTDYDYFVEIAEGVQFTSDSGFTSFPFIGNTSDNEGGSVSDTYYMGRVLVDDRNFYHFRVPQSNSNVGFGPIYINTTLNNDVPGRYALPPSVGGNTGGYWLYTGEKKPTLAADSTVSAWKWYALDGGTLNFPTEYCDKARKEESAENYTSQLGLFNTSSYGFTIRVHSDDLTSVQYKNQSGELQLLSTLRVGVPVEAANGATIQRESPNGNYNYLTFTISGCNNKQALSEVIVCPEDNSAGYQAFPAFSCNNDRYLVSIDYLKSIGVVWEFTKTSDTSYYLGIKTAEYSASRRSSDTPAQYTDVYIGTAGTSSFIIRGTQLTLYPSDRVIVWESDNTYYVDYEAVLGIQKVVSFENNNGAVTLSRENQVAFLSSKQVTNVNNQSDTTAASYEYMQTVKVLDAGGNPGTYIYAPASYVLANWLVVDNKIDSRSGVFSFFASESANSDSEGAKALRSILGVETSGTGWEVYYTDVPPLDSTLVTVEEDGTLRYSKGGALPNILYIPALNAYLLKPHALEPDMAYGEWVEQVSSGELKPLTSIVSKYSSSSSFMQSGYIADWNYNLYTKSGALQYGYVAHPYVAESDDGSSYVRNAFCDMSGWDGDPAVLHSEACALSTGYYAKWMPAAVGVPGLLGYPYATSSTITSSPSVDTYSGIAYVRRAGVGHSILATLVDGASVTEENSITYAVIHMTEHKAWLQSCSFTFTFLDESPLSPDAMTKPSITGGGAAAGFDWEQFFRDVGLQNVDDWLTIAIIAVLNILPRIFMFAFILLMGLSLIANVKPWQAFCDSVFDPYKLLTLGRKDVHTIQLKMVFLYSIIALALFGMFQNGLILNVIAWVARAVTGILSR